MVQPADPSRPVLRVWDVTDGREVGASLPAHTHRLSAVAVAEHPDREPFAVSIDVAEARDDGVGTPRVVTAELSSGRLVAAATDGRGVRLWDLVSAHGGIGAGKPIPDPFGDGPVVDVAAVAAPNDRIVVAVAGLDGALRFWDLEHQTLIQTYNVEATVLAATVTPDGHGYFVAGCWDSSLRVWDGASAVPMPDLTSRSADRADQRRVRLLDVALIHGRLVAVTARQAESRLRRWLLDGSGHVADIRGSDGAATALALSVGSGRPTVVAAGRDRLLHVVDLASGQPVGAPMPLPGMIRAISCRRREAAAVVAGDDVFALVRWRGNEGAPPRASSHPG
jgi:WD40 repeat protein